MKPWPGCSPRASQPSFAECLHTDGRAQTIRMDPNSIQGESFATA